MSGDREVSAEERERWRQVTALVDAAFDLPASERESYLQEHSADESIREAVRRILRVGEADVRAADPFAGVHLASLVDSLVSTSGEFPAAAPRRPQRVGRFRVVRRLGEGGMGTVYLAERDDGEFSQSVALKLVRHGLRHDERIVRRFREERQLLSTLNHASIARLVDGGLTDDGIPWFAMEYVEGSALDRYCDDNRLTVEQRLELFARVCDAVAHAHAAGVVHRDIKPTNILVERDGTPKLLDLGIARLVATEGTAESHVVTRTGERMLTPEYASPEQILGGDVTPATDVYALGVLLYELLTGRRPFSRTGCTPLETGVAILEEEPVRPSNAVTREAADSDGDESRERLSAARGLTPERLSRRLRGDLDAIVLTALRKEPERRYRGGAELSADVRRHLLGVPIMARGDSVPYRAMRFVRRHRTGVAAVAAMAVAIVALVAAWNRQPPELLVPGDAHRITADAGLELDAAISPDGTKLAYVADLEGDAVIHVADLASGTTRAITERMEHAQRSPRWSPDGGRIAFWAGLESYVVPAESGEVRKLANAPEGGWAAHPAWSPDGSRIAYVQSYSVVVRAAEGGPVRTLTSELPDPHSLAWSPDGRWIAVVSGNSAFVFVASIGRSGMNLGNVGPSSVWLVPVNGGSLVRLTNDASLNTSVVWMPGSRSVLMVSSRGGDRDVYRLDLNADGSPAGEPVRVTTGLGAHTISLSRDARKLAYTVFRNSANIWAAELPRAVGELKAVLRPVTTGSQAIEGLALSADERLLAFDSDRSGNQDVYVVPVEGGTPQRLTTSHADDFMPHWSPDGREIAYYTFTEGGTRSLRVLSVEGGEPVPVAGEAGDQRFPAWSPDGATLVFESWNSGISTLHRVSRRANGEWGAPQPLRENASVGRVSPRGDMVAFLYFTVATRESDVWTMALSSTRQ